MARSPRISLTPRQIRVGLWACDRAIESIDREIPDLEAALNEREQQHMTEPHRSDWQRRRGKTALLVDDARHALGLRLRRRWEVHELRDRLRAALERESKR